MSFRPMTPSQIAAAAIDSFVAFRLDGHSVRDAQELAIAAAVDAADLAERQADAAAEDARDRSDVCPF